MLCRGPKGGRSQIENRTYVYRSVNLTGWRAVFAVCVAVAILYLVIVAFFAILSLIAIAVVIAMIGAAIYRLITGTWPPQPRDRQAKKRFKKFDAVRTDLTPALGCDGAALHARQVLETVPKKNGPGF
jgi:hypothetical protein